MPNGTNMPEPSRRRGRPRAYDPELALRHATDTFWDGGFAATSLDDLSAATGMNRPSLYAAFGDKEALYLRAMEQQGRRSAAALVAVLAQPKPLRAALGDVYQGALSIYLTGAHGARGCFLVGTASSEAVMNPRVRAVLATALRSFDDAFERRFRRARTDGELGAALDLAALARIASGVLHTLALRSRAGEGRAVLDGIAASAIDLITPPTAPKPTAPKPTAKPAPRRRRSPRG